MQNTTRAPFGETEDAHIAGLEVCHLWNETVVDTCHFRPSVETVHVGTELGWRWDFLGVDMGFVDAPWHRVLPWLAPVWSEVRSVPRTPLGSDPRAMAGTTVHPLCHWAGEAWQVAVRPGWSVLRDGAPMPLPPPSADGLTRLLVTPEPLVVVAGGQRYRLRQVAAPRRVPRPETEVDPVGLGFLSAFGAAGMALAMAAMWSAPPSEVVLLTQPEDAVAQLLKVPPPPPKPKVPVKPVKKALETPDKAVSRPGRRSGNRRRSDSERASHEAARKAGVFASDAIDRLLGADAGLSSTLASLAGNLRVKGDGGSRLGGFGLGDRHGLGDGPDVEGIGDMGGLYDGPPGGPGGPGGDGFGTKDRGGIDAGGGDSMVMGSLSAEQVDTVIKRHLSQIRFCYQRQLPRDPHLAGKVSVRFVIAGDGSVSLAKIHDSSLGNAEVERCMVDRFFRMTFPEPLGNGTVIVKYPFLFTPG